MRSHGSSRLTVRHLLTTVLAMATVMLGLATAPAAGAAAITSATITTVTVTASVHGFGTPSTAEITVVDGLHHRAVRGTAQFTFDGKAWASRTLNSAGAATIPVPVGTSVGRHTVNARFVPFTNSGYTGSSGGKAFDVIKARAGWTVFGPVTPVYAARTGINFTLHGARVSPGTVTLSLNGRVIVRQNVPSSGFVPLRPTVSWGAGRQRFTLTYSGNAFNRSETRQLVVTTAMTASSMGLAVPAALAYLAGGTAHVAVHGAGATPTGTVTLAVDGQSRTTARLSGGHASLSIPALSGGRHVITTTYGGDRNHRAVSRTATTDAASGQCPVAARACIDLTHSITWLQSGGKITYGPVPMLPGRAGHRTDDGTFNVYFKDLHHLSSEFNGAPMPFSVFFDGGIAFHEGSLSVQSHGCIHLSHDAAQTYFDSLHFGDQVSVFGSAPY